MNIVVKHSCLIGSIIAVLTYGCDPASAAETPATIRFICPAKLTGPLENTNIRCRLKNKSTETIYVLADAFALEGPHNGIPYLYVPTDWDRFENVLQYNSVSTGLDLPTLFHPTVHLDFEQLSRLLPLGSGDAIGVNVTWKPSAAALGDTTLIARLKLVYLPQHRVAELLNTGLPADCRDKFAKAVSSLGRATDLNLDTRGATKGTRWFYDGCRDVISENFGHLYSNALVVGTRKK